MPYVSTNAVAFHVFKTGLKLWQIVLNPSCKEDKQDGIDCDQFPCANKLSDCFMIDSLNHVFPQAQSYSFPNLVSVFAHWRPCRGPMEWQQMQTSAQHEVWSLIETLEADRGTLDFDRTQLRSVSPRTCYISCPDLLSSDASACI